MAECSILRIHSSIRTIIEHKHLSPAFNVVQRTVVDWWSPTERRLPVWKHQPSTLNAFVVIPDDRTGGWPTWSPVGTYINRLTGGRHSLLRSHCWTGSPRGRRSIPFTLARTHARTRRRQDSETDRQREKGRRCQNCLIDDQRRSSRDG